MSTFILAYEGVAFVKVPVEASSPEEAFRLWRLNQVGSTREVSIEIPSYVDVSVCDNQGRRVDSFTLPDPTPSMAEWNGFLIQDQATLIESGFGSVEKSEAPFVKELGRFHLARTLDWLLGITSRLRENTFSAFMERPRPESVPPWADGELNWPRPSRLRRLVSFLKSLSRRKGGNGPC